MWYSTLRFTTVNRSKHMDKGSVVKKNHEPVYVREGVWGDRDNEVNLKLVSEFTTQLQLTCLV